MTTGRPSLHVAGMAVTSGDCPPDQLRLRAAAAALDDAGRSSADISAVLHLGAHSEHVAARVRDSIAATSCRFIFDVGGGPADFVSALAVGASLIVGPSCVLISETGPHGASSVVLTAASVPTTRHLMRRVVIGHDSPVRALLAGRESGYDDVLLVAPGADGASVRCLLV